MRRGGCGACSTQLAASHLKLIFAQHFFNVYAVRFVSTRLCNSSLRCQGMQTPGSSSSAAGGHGGGDRVGKRGRDGDEDPPNDDARDILHPPPSLVARTCRARGKLEEGTHCVLTATQCTITRNTASQRRLRVGHTLVRCCNRKTPPQCTRTVMGLRHCRYSVFRFGC